MKGEFFKPPNPLGEVITVSMENIQIRLRFVLLAALFSLGATSTTSAQTKWTPELRELRAAEDAATKYAIDCFQAQTLCVGILLHLGDDFYARRDKIAETQELEIKLVEKWMVSKFEESYAEDFKPLGVNVKIFPRLQTHNQ